MSFELLNNNDCFIYAIGMHDSGLTAIHFSEFYCRNDLTLFKNNFLAFLMYINYIIGMKVIISVL
jgi:hypothetical protein